MNEGIYINEKEGVELTSITLYNVKGIYEYDQIDIGYRRDGSPISVRISSWTAPTGIIVDRMRRATEEEIKKLTSDAAAYYEQVKTDLLNAEALQ